MPLCGYEGRDNIATYGTKKRALPRTAGNGRKKERRQNRRAHKKKRIIR